MPQKCECGSEDYFFTNTTTGKAIVKDGNISLTGVETTQELVCTSCGKEVQGASEMDATF